MAGFLGRATDSAQTGAARGRRGNPIWSQSVGNGETVLEIVTAAFSLRYFPDGCSLRARPARTRVHFDLAETPFRPSMLHSTVMPLRRAEMPDEPPPFLGSWPRVYAAVIAYLAVLILLLYLFTRLFS